MRPRQLNTSGERKDMSYRPFLPRWPPLPSSRSSAMVAFSPTLYSTSGFLLPAVVADVNEHRIVYQSAAFDVVEQPADAVVPPGHIGVIELGRLRDVHVLVVLAVAVGRVERHVGQRRREPDEERLVLVAVDEIEHRVHGLAHQIIAVGAHQLFEESVAAIGRQIPALAHAFAEMAVAVIVFPPFSALPTNVARLAQQPRQGFKFAHGRGFFELVPKASPARVKRGVVGVLGAAPLNNFVFPQHVLHRMQARDQRAQRRPAIGRRDVGRGKKSFRPWRGRPLRA